jgi:fucose 4-O-acetylase-like acetyltransferase
MALNEFRSAATLAAATPDSRNRYADFLRAVAISAVVLGHWLMAAVWVDDSGFHADNILSSVPATQWLTWALQVMPLFFLVGGFSNAVGWKRYEGGYGGWLHNRLLRLVMPTVPLVGVWSVLGLIAPQFGLDPRLARLGSQVALVPLWFLAVYVLMVAATPLTASVWARYRGRVVFALAAGAVATDIVRNLSFVHVGFINYVFVWGSIYLLGHAWQDGAFRQVRRARQLAAIGGIALVAMTVGGPYHISMVGVPGVEFGNTAPPSAALLALGFAQIGLALCLEAPMRRYLRRPGPWAATIVVNSSIMTLYVWHMTAMALMIGLILLVQPAFLALVPGSTMWWLSRPLWIGVLAIATLPFIVRFRRFEAGSRSTPSARVAPSASIAAAIAVCVSFGSVAAKGLTIDHPVWAGAGVVPLLLVGRWLLLSRSPVGDRELPRR